MTNLAAILECEALIERVTRDLERATGEQADDLQMRLAHLHASLQDMQREWVPEWECAA